MAVFGGLLKSLSLGDKIQNITKLAGWVLEGIDSDTDHFWKNKLTTGRGRGELRDEVRSHNI